MTAARCIRGAPGGDNMGQIDMHSHT
jgi:hypothetical protein